MLEHALGSLAIFDLSTVFWCAGSSSSSVSTRDDPIAECVVGVVGFVFGVFFTVFYGDFDTVCGFGGSVRFEFLVEALAVPFAVVVGFVYVVAEGRHGA